MSVHTRRARRPRSSWSTLLAARPSIGASDQLLGAPKSSGNSIILWCQINGSCELRLPAVATMTLPPIRTAVHDHQPLRQMREIMSHGVHLRAFAVGAVLVMAGGILIPFIAPSFIAVI